MSARSLPRLLLAMLVILAVTSCQPPPPPASGPLPQRGYLWQREWTPAVAAALDEAGTHLDGTVVLGAEIVWENKIPRALRANLPWEILAHARKPVALGVRIAPFPGPFAENDAAIEAIVRMVKDLLDEARLHGVTISEFQLDFDCAQKKLPGYRLWLRKLVPAVHPTRFVITSLPSWLKESEFAALAREVDGYVLQVHSVPTVEAGGKAVLCDPALARQWVAQASRLGLPFSVALPTYRCVAGYDPAGKLLGVAMDSVQPAWPQGTRRLDFATDADEIAGLVREWTAAHPPGLRELLWYRLPVGTDLRNWRWPTLVAVMAGRDPVHHLEGAATEINPVDLSIINLGEADETSPGDLVVRWTGAQLVAADALPGWSVSHDGEKAVFRPALGAGLRLSPGGKLQVGWLRFDHNTAVRMEILPHEKTSP